MTLACVSLIVSIGISPSAARQQPSAPAVTQSTDPSIPSTPGIVSPQVLKSVRPMYTADAKKAKIQGIVRLQVVVMPDGTVAEVHIVKSLDKKHGLDEEAIKAAKLWQFKPGLKDGNPVPVLVTIELTFKLK
jgi:periplasmic protein TonB